MEREEVNKILSDIAVLYPNFTRQSAGTKTQIVNAWEWALKDYSYQSVNNALILYVKTSGSEFAPSVSKLISMTQAPQTLTELNPIEAWAMVRKAICRSSYYAEDEYNKLPEVVQRAVGNPAQLRAWAQSEIESLETVIASNFQRTYKACLERQNTINLIPQDLRDKLIKGSGLSAITQNGD